MSKHAICHIELPAQDRKVAATFYNEMFGWTFSHMDEMQYSTFESGSLPGGFNPLGETVKVGEVVVYLASIDIDADLKQIEALGGKALVPKTEIPGVGWFGIFSDPTGNKLGLLTYLSE